MCWDVRKEETEWLFCAHTASQYTLYTHRACKICKRVVVVCAWGVRNWTNRNSCLWPALITEIAVYKYPVLNVFDLPRLSLLFQLKPSKGTMLGCICLALELWLLGHCRGFLFQRHFQSLALPTASPSSPAVAYILSCSLAPSQNPGVKHISSLWALFVDLPG